MERVQILDFSKIQTCKQSFEAVHEIVQFMLEFKVQTCTKLQTKCSKNVNQVHRLLLWGGQYYNGVVVYDYVLLYERFRLQFLYDGLQFESWTSSKFD